MMGEIKKQKTISNTAILTLIELTLIMCVVEANVYIINNLCLWILACTYLILFRYSILYGISLKCWKKYQNRMLSIVVSVFLSLLLIAVLPFDYLGVLKVNSLEKAMLMNDTIVLTPENNKDKREITIEGIKVNGQDYNLYDISLEEGWEFIDGRPTCIMTNEEVRPLTIYLGKGNKYEIMLRKNQKAGSVRIACGSRSSVYNLYSDIDSNREIINLESVLIDKNTTNPKLWKAIIYYCLYFKIIFEIVICLYNFVYYYLFYKKEKRK